jgi:hypothetical protein
MRSLMIVALGASMACGSSTPSAPATNNPPAPQPAVIPSDVSPAVRSMLEAVPQQIASALTENRSTLPLNPNIASYINAKIAMLERSTLLSEIYNGRFFVEGSTTSISGRVVPVLAVFAQEQMRTEATEAVRAIERSLPVLEEFMRTAFPTAEIRLWYGFKIGNSGGGGAIFSEDRTTYEARTPATRLPFNAILFHEVSHSYIGSEGMNQFLELYVYNVLQTGSSQLSSWTFLRGWTPMLDANKDVAAVLDVYQWLGKDAMSSAYAALYPLRPPYGSPLTPPMIQVFVDRAPAANKTQVSQKLGQVTF